MPARDDVPLGAPVWNDLGTDDLAATVAFYTGLFGWEHVDHGPELGHYGTFTLDGEPVAGVGPNPEPGTPSAWQVYLKVDDAAATHARALAAGAAPLTPLMEIPGQGTMAFVLDPGGAAIGLWQAGGHDGFTVTEEPSAPTWHELMTKDFAATVPFYEQVFGWTVQVQGDTDDFRYSVHASSDRQWAGVMDASGFLPAEVPSFWSVYLEVPDADEATARAVELGGTVVDGPEDTPYGRLATLADPSGARFRVMARQGAA